MEQNDIKPTLPKIMMSQEVTKYIPDWGKKKNTGRNFALWRSEKKKKKI